MRNLLFSFIAISLVVGTVWFAPQPANAAVTNLDAVAPGSLIKGESRTAVYYFGIDGFRYVFTQDKVFFSWYDDFNSVITISDADLGTVQIGGNVTYRPGTTMIKIESDPKTYALDANGARRWVTSETVAVGLYGSNWNQQIYDVPDAFFANYQSGDEITDASQFNRSAITAAAADIGADKGLVAPAEMSITSSDYSPTLVTITAGGSVRWTNNANENHTATADNLSWGSGTIAPDSNFVRRFESPGTYTFFDSYDPTYTGTVIVQ